MITPKIKFPPEFKPGDADQIVSNSVVIKQITPEEVWPYLINISDWNRFTKEVMDADFIDPQVEDPHLYPRVEFTYKTAGLDIVARTLEVIKPKDDRAGRLAWEGSVKGDDGKSFSFVHAWLVEMAPDHGVEITSEMLLKGAQATDSLAKNLKEINAGWLDGLLAYAGKHLVQTNHPRHPLTGGNVR